MKQKIYLDHNATTPLLPEVLEAMKPFWREAYGNPSSIHEAGAEASRAIRKAREEVASLLGARDESEIIFTSGGTESNNAVFRSVSSRETLKRRIVITSVEHSSVLKVAKALQEEGRAEIHHCPVDAQGNLDPEQLDQSVNELSALVSVMAANNETGVLFPVEAIGKQVQAKGVLFHVDAVQAVGKISFSLKEAPIDFLSLSGHKLGGPKGVGVLYVRKGVPFRPLCFGGSQERGNRAGTENVPGIVGLGAACRYWRKHLGEVNQRVQGLRDNFEREILREIPQSEINGDPTNRLPNTSNLAFEGVDSEALLILLDQEGVFASSGSACLSGAPEPSHVLKAMGFSNERANSSVRFSFGLENRIEEIIEAVRLVKVFIGRLREIELEEQHPHSIV